MCITGGKNIFHAHKCRCGMQKDLWKKKRRKMVLSTTIFVLEHLMSDVQRVESRAFRFQLQLKTTELGLWGAMGPFFALF